MLAASQVKMSDKKIKENGNTMQATTFWVSTYDNSPKKE